MFEKTSKGVQSTISVSEGLYGKAKVFIVPIMKDNGRKIIKNDKNGKKDISMSQYANKLSLTLYNLLQNWNQILFIFFQTHFN